MALTWDVTKIKDHEAVTTHPNDPHKWNPVTEALVWHSLGYYMPEITEDNHLEVATRIYMWERVAGPLMYEDNEPRYITLADVRSHIGLVTNTFPKRTRTQFMKALEGVAEGMVKRQDADSPGGET